MDFGPKPGCPMCGIVASALHATPNSPRSSPATGSSQHEVLWRDGNFTAYRERTHPVSSKVHIIIAFNLHVPSIYTLSSSDLPLLVDVRNLAQRLLSQYIAASPASPSMAGNDSANTALRQQNTQFRIGFITPPFKDNKIPVTDHLHAHAYIAPGDLMGWWRGIAYSGMAWYAIDDLIAEIRETTSNNRVKSGYENRPTAPIDTVPYAGVRQGNPDGVETTEGGIAAPDLEDGQRTPSITRSPPLSTLSPERNIPNLRV